MYWKAIRPLNLVVERVFVVNECDSTADVGGRFTTERERAVVNEILRVTASAGRYLFEPTARPFTLAAQRGALLPKEGTVHSARYTGMQSIDRRLVTQV